MSFTKNQIISILSERQGRPFDLVFQQELKDIIDYWRATIIKQTLQKQPSLDRYFQQSFVMPLIKVDKVSCPIQYDCILRTQDLLPSPLKYSNTILNFVGSADLEDAFPYITADQLKFYKYRPYTSHIPAYMYLDNYLYIIGNDTIKYLGVKGVFTDIKSIKNFKCVDNCYSDDDPYPATDDVIQQIIQAILSVEFARPIQQVKEEVELNK